MHKRHINEFMHTGFANTGRAAGAGITYDRYDDESGHRPKPRDTGQVRFPHDGENTDELNGPVIIYKGEKKIEPIR